MANDTNPSTESQADGTSESQSSPVVGRVAKPTTRRARRPNPASSYQDFFVPAAGRSFRARSVAEATKLAANKQKDGDA